MNRQLGAAVLVALAMTQLSACSSFLLEGGSAGAGIAGSSIAGAVTSSAAVATGIGIGVQSVTRAGIQYEQRKIHGEAQQQIAAIGGLLKVGQVRTWKSHLSLPIQPVESGRVTVSRVISTGELDCKEIVFSVDRSGSEQLTASEFYVASICRSGSQWAWASAEPATGRWGALQ